MDSYRTFIDSDKLEGVLDLPEQFKNRRVEVVVKSTEVKPKDPARIEAAIERLCGIIPYKGKDLDDYRAERINEKYGI